MGKRKYRTQAEWKELISLQLKSGMSVPAFCQQHDLKTKTFYRQRKALENPPDVNTVPTAAFVKVQASSALRAEAIVSDMTLQHGESRLILPANTSPAWVAKLLQALS